MRGERLALPVTFVAVLGHWSNWSWLAPFGAYDGATGLQHPQIVTYHLLLAFASLARRYGARTSAQIAYAVLAAGDIRNRSFR